MPTISFKHNNVCSRESIVEIDDNDVIQNIKVIGGCMGNLQGVCALLKGMKVEEAISRLDGIQCRNGTSCPDQIAKGLKNYLNSKH